MRLATLLLSLTLLAACASDPTTLTPTSTPTPEVAATMEVTATRATTPRPIVTAIPVASPSPTLSLSLESPDGALHAHIEFRFDACPQGCFLVFENSDGGEVRRVPFTDPGMNRFSGGWAAYSVDRWLDDSSGVVLGGGCECDGPGLRPIVVVTTAGEVIDRDVSVYAAGSSVHIAPSGRYALTLTAVPSWEVDSLGCEVPGSGAVFDLLSGDAVDSFGEEGDAVASWEWVDGYTLAYSLRPLPDPEAGTCTEQYAEWAELPADSHLLTLLGSGAS